MVKRKIPLKKHSKKTTNSMTRDLSPLQIIHELHGLIKKNNKFNYKELKTLQIHLFS